MAPKPNQPDPNQPSLFDEPMMEVPVEPIPEMSPIYVDIATRSAYLQEALGHIAQANMRAGFTWASDTPHRRDIEARYGHNTQGMLEGADFNRQRAYDRAKTAFAFAFGKMAMIDAGMDRTEVDSLVDDAFSVSGQNKGSDKGPFLKEYADTKNRDNREAYRKQLRKSERIRAGKKR